MRALLAGLALAFAASAPLPATAADAAASAVAMPAHDPAKMAVVAQILDNLQTMKVSISAGQKSLLADPTVAKLAPADQTLLVNLFADEMMKRHDEMMNGLAADNSDRFTLEQLNDILTYSRIGYVQNLCLDAAGLAPSTPDPSTMTAQEAKDFATIGNASYTNDFLDNFNFTSESAVVSEAVATSIQRFVALRGHGDDAAQFPS